VNAGHDLDLDNLVMFRRLPHLDEVSIGHALVSHALFVGLTQSVREYLTFFAGMTYSQRPFATPNAMSWWSLELASWDCRRSRPSAAVEAAGASSLPR
jgi:hypothetical protein